MRKDAKRYDPSRELPFTAEYISVWPELIGSRITHLTFGSGEVTEMGNRRSLECGTIWIRFDSGREVQLSLKAFLNGTITELVLTPEALESIQAKQLIVAAEESRKRRQLEDRARQEQQARIEAITKRQREQAAQARKRQQKSEEPRWVTATRHTATKQSEKEVQEAERRRQIMEFCNRRNIKELVHFTRVENLRSILQQGLLGRKRLEALAMEPRPIFNDGKRMDEQLEAVCLSVSFPNYKTFYKLHRNMPDSYVVIQLKSDVLWELDCAFCRENAAAAAVSRIPLADRRQFAALELMFADFGDIRREELGIPDSYPTNPQAEVLVLEPIGLRYIVAVHFASRTEWQKWASRNGSENSPEFLLKSHFFTPRQDYRVWKKQQSESQLSHVLPDEPPFSYYNWPDSDAV